VTSQELERLVQPLLEELGYELVQATASRTRFRHSFRIYADKADGIAVKDCAFLSRTISQVLDQDPTLAGAYGIEVSSPGMNRPVRTLEQFRRFSGERVNISLKSPREGGRRRWKGEILLVEDDEIKIALTEGGEEKFRLEEIQEAHLEMDPWKNAGSKKARGKKR
jgi:ribosome maturation factor RimP